MANDEARLYYELYQQISNELELLPGNSSPEDSHASARAAWALFVDVVDTKGFRDLLNNAGPVPNVSRTCEVVLEKVANEQSFGFGIHNLPDKVENVLIMDRVIDDGMLDNANRKMRQQGALDQIVQPFGVLMAVNEVSGDTTAMLEELVSKQLVKLRVMNPRKVEEAVAIVDHVRGLGSVRDGPPWWTLAKEPDSALASTARSSGVSDSAGFAESSKASTSLAVPNDPQVESAAIVPSNQSNALWWLFECGCSNLVRDSKRANKKV